MGLSISKISVGLLAVILLLSGAACWGECPGCEGDKTPGPAIEASGSQSAIIVGENETVNFSVSASDTDICGDPEPVDDSPLIYTWSGATPTYEGSSSASQYWAAAGTYIVTCTVDDDGQCGNDEEEIVTFTVIVTPLPDPSTQPDDPGNGDGGSGQGNDMTSGGGCSSCASGAGWIPAPSLREQATYLNAWAPGEIMGPGIDGSNTGPDGYKRTVMQTYDNDGKYITYWDASGKTYNKEFPTNTWEVDLEDGVTITKNRTGSLWNGTFTVTEPSGTQINFNGWYSVDDESAATGPSSIIDANGSTTTYDRNSATGAVDEVTLPTGQFWSYYHATGDNKVLALESGDRFASITYVSSGNGIGKLESVEVWIDSQVAWQVDYTYNEDDKIETATVGDREIEYTWDTDMITMTETSVTPQVQTVYDYDTTTTTITRKHQSNSSLDQPTVYTFYTESDVKTYVNEIEDALGNATTYDVYTSGSLKGKVYQVTDALNRETDYTYNDNGLRTLSTVTYPDDSTVEYTYYTDASSNPTVWTKTVKDVRGNYTHYDRNAGTLWQVAAVKVSAPISGQAPTEQQWAAIDPIKQYAYYGTGSQYGLPGQLQTETVPDIDGTTDQVMEYKYNYSTMMKSSPTQTIYQYWNGLSYESKTSSAVYDVTGELISTTDAENKTIAYPFDWQHRRTKVIYETNIETENHYGCCVLEWSDDEDGRRTYYGYDYANRLTSTWTSAQMSGETKLGNLVEYTFDAFNNHATEITKSDASTARTTTYTYDKLNRVIEIEYPYDTNPEDLLGNEEFGYDAVGNLWWKIDGTGAVTLYRYDDLNRLIDVYYNYTGSLNPPSYVGLTADVTYTYYGGSSLKHEMTDDSGTSHYDYDIQGRLTSYTPPVPSQHAAVEYEYNNLGQKTSVTSGDYDVEYEYYANGWLKNVKTDGGTLTLATYYYDPSGFRNWVDYGNGAMTEIVQDWSSRHMVYNLIHRASDWDTIIALSYSERDNSGNPTLIQDDQSNETVYTYDANGRLASSQYPGEQNPTTFFYDWVGNRINPPANPYQLMFTPVDSVEQIPDVYTYYYNDAGGLNEVQDTQAPPQVVSSYTYHSSGLLNEATYPGGGELSNTWDAAGNRVGLTINEVDYTFVYDVTAGIPAVIEEDDGTTTICYYREPSGALIARRVGATGTTWRYYHFDELGSTRALTDEDGEVTDTYTYDAWGNVTDHTGSTEQPYQYVGQLGYYTHYQDPDFNLLQLGVRFNDPEIGRFTSRDSAGDGLNLYAYVANNPLAAIDPSGKVAIWPIIKIGYTVGTGIIATYAAVKCAQCISRQHEMRKTMWEHYNCPGMGGGDLAYLYLMPNSCPDYADWLKRVKPGEECGEICRIAGYSGAAFVGGLIWNKGLLRLIKPALFTTVFLGGAGAVGAGTVDPPIGNTTGDKNWWINQALYE